MPTELIPGLKPGMSAYVEKKIVTADTAQGMGRDVLDTLLATPAYVNLMIQAAVEVLRPNFPYDKNYITVGTAMSFAHDAPSALGMTVRVIATLTKIEGNRFFFNLEAFDEVGPIGHGTHERAMVHLGGLNKKINERTQKFKAQSK